jgi:hypothetical protein
MIYFGDVLWILDVIVGSYDDAREFAEQNWLCGDRLVLLLTMISVVQANANNFIRLCYRGQQLDFRERYDGLTLGNNPKKIIFLFR